MEPQPDAQYLVMPRDPSSWAGAAALWVTAAGWAAAMRRRGARPVVVTPAGLMSENDCLAATALVASPGRGQTSRIPAPLRLLVRDGQRALAMRSFAGRAPDLAKSETDVSLVWQHHDLFNTAGQKIARAHDAPLIEYVHAPIVWEANRWGVARPGWSALLERVGERPQLRAADLVACVSDEVAAEVVRIGVPAERVIVSPMGVDPELFSPDADSMAWEQAFSGLGEFVVGWIGSFRRFHAIDVALDALQILRGRGLSVGLVLVGDGADRERLQGRVEALDLQPWVRFTGQVSNLEMPRLLGALHATVITASANQAFHYSPLKLREYLAMGRAVVAPRLGEIERMLSDGENAMLYEPGNASQLASSLELLAQDQPRRERLGLSGRELLLRTGTWDVIVNQALARLQT